MLTTISNFKRNLRLIAAGFAFPHPEKAHFGGEDAFFVNSEKAVIGVADGVGGWANHPGANAAEYSKTLMRNCSNNSNLGDPLQILEMSYKEMPNNLIGSTTAVIASLDKSNKVHLLNLGDSGYIIVRGGKIVFISPPQQHGFNFPFQLGTNSRDEPKNSDRRFFTAKEGDALILATDGVLDNMWPEEILSCLMKETTNTSKPEDAVKRCSETIAKEANRIGSDKNAKTPFAVEAQKNGYSYIGGKLDDSTVVTALLVE